MKKSNLIPITKQAAKPKEETPKAPQGVTIEAMVQEGYACMRLIDTAKVKLGEIMTSLANEVMVREQKLGSPNTIKPN